MANELMKYGEGRKLTTVIKNIAINSNFVLYFYREFFYAKTNGGIRCDIFTFVIYYSYGYCKLL